MRSMKAKGIRFKPEVTVMFSTEKMSITEEDRYSNYWLRMMRKAGLACTSWNDFQGRKRLVFEFDPPTNGSPSEGPVPKPSEGR